MLISLCCQASLKNLEHVRELNEDVAVDCDGLQLHDRQQRGERHLQMSEQRPQLLCSQQWLQPFHHRQAG